MADGDPEDLELDPPADEQEDEAEEQETEEQQTEGEQPEVLQTQEQDRQPEQERQPTRRDSRIETLTRSLSEERQARTELNRRLDALLAGQQPRQQGESPEQRAQRLALLTPEERITETLRESEAKHAQEMQQVRFAVVDGNDRAAFEAKATVDPLYAKWKSRVETELAVMRQQNMNVDREKLMYYLIGKNAVEARTKTNGKQRAAAQGRVRSQTTRPSNSGSDTQANRRTAGNSLERRLADQSI